MLIKIKIRKWKIYLSNVYSREGKSTRPTNLNISLNRLPLLFTSKKNIYLFTKKE